MSLPVVLPCPCRPPTGSSRGESPRRQTGFRSAALPGRPLLSLGLLQLLLGGSMVALSYGALSLSSSAPVRSSCPLWAGSSVILSGIVALLTWRRPMLLMVNMFVLLSVVCVLLSLTGFVLCCQGAQLVSNMSSCQQVGDMCYCCLLARSSKCPEDKLLELPPAQSCTTMKILLKKMLFALCALNALTTAVCLMAAALRFLRLFSSRTSCLDEPSRPVEEEEPSLEPDPDIFVPPAPPPSYFSTFYSYTPRLARRVLRDGVIPLPHIHSARIKGVEVFCPLDPPPPYEEVAGGRATPQGPDSRTTGASSSAQLSVEVPRVPGPMEQLSSARPSQTTERVPSVESVRRKARMSRSSSDPVLTEEHPKGWSSEVPALTVDSSTQTSQPMLSTKVTLRRSCGVKVAPRHSYLVDYQSYRHTQLLVQRILEQPAQGLAPELQELVDSIHTVLRSDQEHMEEAVRCAGIMDQVLVDSERRSSVSQTFPRPPQRRMALLHLQSCGDLSSVVCPSLDSLKKAAKRRGTPRPQRHSLATLSRETVL